MSIDPQIVDDEDLNDEAAESDQERAVHAIAWIFDDGEWHACARCAKPMIITRADDGEWRARWENMPAADAWPAIPAYELPAGTRCDSCRWAGTVSVWTAEQSWLTGGDDGYLMLLDADTGNVIDQLRVDNAELIAAAGKAPSGVILVDADGELVAEGSWSARQPGVRRAYVVCSRKAVVAS